MADERTIDGGRGSGALFGQFMAEFGVTDTRFALGVNERARRQKGQELGLARTTVGHWRRGMRPRDSVVADLAAAELSDIVGYTITASDLGWRGTGAPDDLGLSMEYTPASTVRTLAGLSGRDVRGGAPRGVPFVPAALSTPALASVTGVADLAPAEPKGSAGARIAELAGTLRGLDAQYGSAGIRDHAVTLLHQNAVAALRTTPGRAVLAALGDLAQLTGWLTLDSGHHAAAQRYYVQALALSEHGGDAALSACVLVAMSVQAGETGGASQLRLALALARAAITKAGGRAVAAVRAILHDRHAHSLADVGDESGCLRALDAADAAVATIGPDDTPPWAEYYGHGDVAACRGRCLARLSRREDAVAHLLRARAALPERRARARAGVEIDLAMVRLAGPGVDLDVAMDTAERALGLAHGVDSARTADRLRKLDAALAPHAARVAVREWRTKLTRHLHGTGEGAGAPSRTARGPARGRPSGEG